MRFASVLLLGVVLLRHLPYVSTTYCDEYYPDNCTSCAGTNYSTQHIICILKYLPVPFVGECPYVNVTSVQLLLYTNQNQSTPTVLNYTRPTQVNQRRRLIILVPDWLSNSTDDGVQALKNAYLGSCNGCNVIIVDWSQQSNQTYGVAFCSAPSIADIIAHLIVRLWYRNLDLDRVHLVGKGVGAHICGMVGRLVYLRSDEYVGRITGLNPAKPLYQRIRRNYRLDEDDASCVVVLYMGQSAWEHSESLASKTYYLNGGSKVNSTVMVNHTSSDARCSSDAIWKYLAESFSNPNNFKAVRCEPMLKSCVPVGTRTVPFGGGSCSSADYQYWNYAVYNSSSLSG